MSLTPIFEPPAALLDALQSSRRPLLITHIAPDGDALGSLLAAGMMCWRLGKDPILACQDRVPMSLQFLPAQDSIVDAAEDEDVDMIIAVDCSDRSRLGNVYQPRRHGRLPMMVIDHHVTNDRFGHVNWVEPAACATAELVYDLGLALGVPLEADAATCLLTAVVTDTRGFTTFNTTPRALRLAATLTEAGAPLGRILETALHNRSFAVVRLWGRALETVELEEGVVSVVNSKRMRTDLNGLVRAEGLVSFLLSANEARIAIVFTELPEGLVECSLRARPGFDVATLALELGGGGHTLAAGFTVAGKLNDVRADVVSRLRRSSDGSMAAA